MSKNATRNPMSHLGSLDFDARSPEHCPPEPADQGALGWTLMVHIYLGYRGGLSSFVESTGRPTWVQDPIWQCEGVNAAMVTHALLVADAARDFEARRVP